MMMFNLEEHKQCNILVTTPTHTRRDYNTRTYKMCLSSDGCMQIAKKKSCLEKPLGVTSLQEVKWLVHKSLSYKDTPRLEILFEIQMNILAFQTTSLKKSKAGHGSSHLQVDIYESEVNQDYTEWLSQKSKKKKKGGKIQENQSKKFQMSQFITIKGLARCLSE